MSGASVIADIEPAAAPNAGFVRRPALSVWTILKWAIAICAVVVAVFPIWWMVNVVFAHPGEPVSINPRLYPTSLSAGFAKIRMILAETDYLRGLLCFACLQPADHCGRPAHRLDGRIRVRALRISGKAADVCSCDGVADGADGGHHRWSTASRAFGRISFAPPTSCQWFCPPTAPRQGSRTL